VHWSSGGAIVAPGGADKASAELKGVLARFKELVHAGDEGSKDELVAAGANVKQLCLDLLAFTAASDILELARNSNCTPNRPFLS
jgi:hypothetical protein